MAGESLSMFPSGFKAGKLYSQIPIDGVGDFDVSRPSVATRVNKLGLIETMLANVPRLDYTDGVCPVLLVEPQRTNLYLNMEVMVTQNVTVAASEYTVSFYGTGTITFTGTHTGSLIGTGLNDLVSITFTPSAGTLISTISGTVTEGQIELGDFPSSRIRTLGTTVTRLADVITGAGDVNTFSNINSFGVLFVEMAALSDDGTTRTISLTDGTTSNRINLNYTTVSNQIQAFISVEGVVSASLFHTLTDITDFSKIAIKWKVNDFALWINGVEVDTDLSGNSFGSNILTTSSFNRGDAITKDFYGKVRQLQVLPFLSDDELITLTTP